MKAEKGFDLETNYLVLADGPAARRIEVGPDFWQTVDHRDDLAGRLVGIFRYDADHAFVNEQRAPVHDRQAAELAWDRSVAFFKKHLA